jgi:hypothetical protein
MKLHNLALAALFAISFSAQAHAVALYDGYDMGTVANGTYVIPYGSGLTSDGDLVTNMAYGILPVNKMITFTYTFTPPPLSGDLNGLGAFSEIHGINYFTSLSTSTVDMDGHTVTTTQRYKNGNPVGTPTGTFPIGTSALFDPISGIGKVTIINLADAAASFSSYFLGLLGSGNVYTTAVVSTVPLPAALPLFGMGLIGLAGYGRRAKAKKDAAKA